MVTIGRGLVIFSMLHSFDALPVIVSMLFALHFNRGWRKRQFAIQISPVAGTPDCEMRGLGRWSQPQNADASKTICALRSCFRLAQCGRAGPLREADEAR